jgi:hypothetical protein
VHVFLLQVVFVLNGECLCGGIVSCRQALVSLSRLEASQPAGATRPRRIDCDKLPLGNDKLRGQGSLMSQEETLEPHSG